MAQKILVSPASERDAAHSTQSSSDLDRGWLLCSMISLSHRDAGNLWQKKSAFYGQCEMG